MNLNCNPKTKVIAWLVNYIMRLKQSNNIGKQFQLPQIKKQEYHKLSPRNYSNNRSLPKIISNSVVDHLSENSVLHNDNRQYQEKRNLKEKLQSLYKKKKVNTQADSIQHPITPKGLEEANITSQFQREIQKNLKMIKREKENKKNADNINKRRYHSPASINNSTNEIKITKYKDIRCVTEEDVFSKINEIIMSSQSKSSHLINNERSISFSAYVKKKQGDKIPAKPIQNNSRMKIKTEPQQTRDYLGLSSVNSNPIKHNGNYAQWRRLSIDSNECELKYNVSSYQMQTERLQKIRNRNDNSLRKYFQGKSYLSKLVNYRDSSSSLERQREM